MNEIELEVFRADQKASRGITSKDIAALAASYDPAAHPAAICIGHPTSDTPAHGIIAGFRAEGNKLFAKLKDVGSEVVEGIKTGKLLNRSMAFFGPGHEANPTPGKLAARHLGFLGASAPGIPGMTNLKKALSFSADGEDLEVDGAPAPAIVFDAPEDPTTVFTVTDKESNLMDPAAIKEANDALAAERKLLDEEKTAFAAQCETARKASSDAIVDGLVAAGKLLPADADKAKLIFGALAPEPLEFTAGAAKEAPAAALASLLSGGVKLVDVDGERKSPTTGEFTAADKDDPAKIESAARKLMASDSSLTFEAAVEAVTKEA